MALSDDPQFERDKADFFAGRLGRLFDELKPGVWHVTSPQGYLGIRRSGMIGPSSGMHPMSFPQTSNSYAMMKQYVSLFDLGSAEVDQCLFMSWKWTTFFSHFRPFTVAFELDCERIREALVPNSEARADVAYKKVWIPYVEAWHRGPIPLSAVRRYLVLPSDYRIDELWLNAVDSRHAELERRAAPGIDSDAP